MRQTLILALSLLLVLAPVVQAQQPGGAAGDKQQYAYRELSAISGVITASTMEAWFTSPTESSAAGTHYIGFNVAGPDIPTGGVATFTASTIAATGCTIGTWVTVSETLAAGTGATSYAPVTMTGSDCTGVAEMQIQAGVIPVTLARFRFPFDIHVTPTAFTNTLSGGVTVTDDANGWAVTGIPDTQQELQAIADAITLLQSLGITVSGSLAVDIVDDTTDDGLLSMPVGNLNATFNNASFPTTVPSSFEVSNEVSDFWFPILFWIACILVCWRKGWHYALWGAFPGLINTLLPDLFPAPLNDFTTLFLLFVMACAAEFWSFRGKASEQGGTWS